MPRYIWTPEEEAVVLHIMEKVILDQKGSTREAFKEAADHDELKKYNRTPGGVKYHWTNDLRKKATGRLGEWVKKIAIYRGIEYKSIPTKVKESSRRAHILQLLNMASDELDLIDEQLEAAIEKVKALGVRKLELNKNIRRLAKELEEITAAKENEPKVDVESLVELTEKEDDEATLKQIEG
ncbi:hypothetical protein IAQ67_28545 (plasmid) [Paenibacillus peoriae]|uniref:Myb-like domain-containing protein n=1 Tax=Paenibacillus peoriae TaxID=59893 RepID=A0A7H0YHA5_9BACL|nr:hypothetical protein [Paenibacillus peoriae]QNR70463.1 hypothetical protein IAQ67_28545 [Paenibacillus peoriae]